MGTEVTGSSIGINDIVYDRSTKDIVMITNRLPVEGGSWKPYEALAWRVLGYENRRAIIGMVCVEVVGHRFESVSPKAEREFRERVNVRRTKYNLGFP